MEGVDRRPVAPGPTKVMGAEPLTRLDHGLGLGDAVQAASDTPPNDGRPPEVVIALDVARASTKEGSSLVLHLAFRQMRRAGATGLRMLVPPLIVSTAITAGGVFGAAAQEAEPRSYSNAPVGLNFLIAGFVHSEGKLAFDPSLSIADAKFRAETAAVAYVRTLDLWGKSAKLDLIVPYSSFVAEADVADVHRIRRMPGLLDPRLRLSVNWVGAPALSPAEFENYRQDLIIGTSLQISAPVGQYDDTKLLNLGNNRWSIRPELGISKAWDQWTVEVAPSVTFFSENTDFFNGKRFQQAPFYLVQGHVIYNFPSGIWASLDAIYYIRGAYDGEWDQRQQ